jgi:hypothetical protein
MIILLYLWDQQNTICFTVFWSNISLTANRTELFIIITYQNEKLYKIYTAVMQEAPRTCNNYTIIKSLTANRTELFLIITY